MRRQVIQSGIGTRVGDHMCGQRHVFVEYGCVLMMESELDEKSRKKQGVYLDKISNISIKARIMEGD